MKNKNIHLLPTYNASRLHNTFNVLRLEKGFDFSPCNLNIYITNSEEIKEGDWKYNELGIGSISKTTKENIDGIKRDKEKGYTNHLYKIILTTNQDLIKDGVQPINDEFLEWFVKNSSCEEVKLENHVLEFGYNHYKTIIPKEELKQEKTFENILDESLAKTKVILEELRTMNTKQETLEEAAERFYSEQSKAYEDEIEPMFDISRYLVAGFIEGAKWQKERMFSEEEVLNLLEKGRNSHYDSLTIKEWFEQFKKKTK